MQGTGWAGGRAGTGGGAPGPLVGPRPGQIAGGRWSGPALTCALCSAAPARHVRCLLTPTFQLSSCQPAPRGPACGRAPHTVLHPGRSRGKTLASRHLDASQIVTPAAEAAHTARKPLHGRRRPGPTSRVAKFRADLIADGHVHYLCTLLWTLQIRLVTPTKRKEIRS